MGDSAGRGANPPPPESVDSSKRELEAADQRLRQVLGSTDGIVIELDADGRCLAIWTRTDELLAAPQATVVGRTLEEILGPEVARPLVERVHRVVSTGQFERFEYAMEVAGGRRWFCAETLSVSPHPSVTFLIRDITLQKTLELRLIQADRLASLGTLAASVAHEVSNPLGYISANLNFALSGMAEMRKALLSTHGAPPDLAFLTLTLEECREALDEARQGTVRLLHVTGDLKTYARGDDSIEGWADVRQAFESAINMAQGTIQLRAQLINRLQMVPPVRGSEARLGQVFLNLLLNAAQAIPEGSADRHTVEVRLGVEGPWVVAEVRDSGDGISPEHLKRIFDPFFTTKPVGVGTGLGLSICHSIVKGLGGEITVESTVGQGTCFRVTLPLRDAATPPTPAPL
ncbi:ATP-binding protein [Stigmatella sp. ncwal1]|uniref:histidine kinase n=1 Tax=Stigmatella ashevillensis TaxID=2995309 RepID=A0ABT5DCS2_9BACT|nr:ATP-binding protein [Stigmatella ashevillena]MDC0710829.1 ATP-binding protein [Stigmatella ashevillena]